MEPDEFNISSPQRLATSWRILKEAGGIDRQEAGALLQAMWAGWSQVMHIQIRAMSDCADGRQPGKSRD